MAHNVDTMAYYGEPPWHGLGVPIPERANSATMIRAAGLDWEVRKEPVLGARRDRPGRPLRYQLVRKARGEGENDVLLGLVSGRYRPLQNEEAFAFFDSIVGSKEAIFETAGALGDGERVWVLARMPGEIRVASNDAVGKYLLLSNAHNGRESVTVKFTPIRVVCQNTLILAVRTGSRSVKVRHTDNMPVRLQEVPDLLGISRGVFESAERSFRLLARTKLDSKRFEAYLEEVMPRSEKQRKEDAIPKRWERVTDIFETRDFGVPAVQGTLWAAYNAVTFYEDYREAREATPDRRLDRVWFGAGADLKVVALVKARELAEKWMQQPHLPGWQA